MQRMLWAMLLALACGDAAKGKKAHFIIPAWKAPMSWSKASPPS